MRSLLVLIALFASSCTASQPAREYVDADTAATISVANRSWVFARERSDLAVHAQDYITVTPVQINRNGVRVLYLYCQPWSTIDRRDNTAVVPPNVKLALQADDRRVELPTQVTDIRKLGFGSAPVAAPNNSAEIRVQAIDVDLLRFIVSAAQLRIALSGDSTEYFLLWRDGSAAAADFLARVETQQ